jgi:hypothetical protein
MAGSKGPMLRLTKEHIENNIIYPSGQVVGDGMAEVTYYVALPFVVADDGIADGMLQSKRRCNAR